jgi:tRNA-specific 2-thiouridylase
LNKKEKVQDFLKENLEENKTGKIEDEEGTVLGQHQGLVYYTQGQRKGLDLSSGPFYVTGKDSERNVLSVSKNKKHSALLNREILIEDVNWIGRLPVENKNYSFKSRYRAQLTTGVVIKEENNWRAVLSEPQWAVAKGQSLVVYDGEEVLGGGIIKEVL